MKPRLRGRGGESGEGGKGGIWNSKVAQQVKTLVAKTDILNSVFRTPGVSPHGNGGIAACVCAHTRE